MNENSVIHLKRSTAFEKTGETVTIEITVHNSSPERLKLLGGTVDVLCTELRQYFNDGKSVPPTGGSNIPRPGEHLREILLDLQTASMSLDFNMNKIGQGDDDWLVEDLKKLRQAIRKLKTWIG